MLTLGSLQFSVLQDRSFAGSVTARRMLLNLQLIVSNVFLDDFSAKRTSFKTKSVIFFIPFLSVSLHFFQVVSRVVRSSA